MELDQQTEPRGVLSMIRTEGLHTPAILDPRFKFVAETASKRLIHTAGDRMEVWQDFPPIVVCLRVVRTVGVRLG